jgi:hypothetical protein
MQRRVLISRAFGSLIWLNTGIAGRMLGEISEVGGDSVEVPERSNPQSAAGGAQATPTVPGEKEIIEHIFKREKVQDEIIASYAPIVETYIQIEKSNALMGTVPKSDLYFLGQADFRGKTMKVHPMTERTHKGSIMWSFEPAGFLQMAFLDYGEFDQDH